MSLCGLPHPLKLVLVPQSSWDSRNIRDKYLSPLSLVRDGRGPVERMRDAQGKQSESCHVVSNDVAPPARLPYTSLCWFSLSSTEDNENEEEIVHMGNAIMSFYSALIDLLGRCAPEMHVSDKSSQQAILRGLNPEHRRLPECHFSFCLWHSLTCLSLWSF